MNSLYYKGAHAVCLVYDSTNSESFEGLDYWVKELDQCAGEEIVRCVIASKVDDDENKKVSSLDASEYAKKIGAQFYETSSKDGTGINDLFQSIAERLHL